uniref:Uncharacterized protein n=1 Tax=Setaria italica TaxID=4555 RepID=K3ZMI1_SETIT
MIQGTATWSHPTMSPCPTPLLSPASAVNLTQLAMVTPFQPVSPGTMATPDLERTYLHLIPSKMCVSFSRIPCCRTQLCQTRSYILIAEMKPKNFTNSMWAKCDASHNTTVNVLAELYGGRQNFTFIEKDFRNRKAATATEERENDIPMLLEFFKEMKAQNEYFYYEVQDEQANTFEWLFGVFQNCMSGSDDPRCILTGEECTIHEIWESRKSWVASYLKPLYYGRMTSTQRSESIDVYLVTHMDQSWEYAWFQHFFSMEAHYIMKRYMRGARMMVMWDRYDIVTSGPGCESDQYKTKKLCAPREARTKGRKRGGKQVVNDHASSSKALGQRTCRYCGSLGHYSTGCDVNPDNANKKRGASGSLRGKM